MAFGVVVSVNSWLNFARGSYFALRDLEVSRIGDGVKL